MIRIGVVDENFEKMASAIRSVYSLKSNSMRYSRDYSVEFAEDIFFSPGCMIPYVINLKRRGVQLEKPSVVIINGVDKERGYELTKDYAAVLVNTDDIDPQKHISVKSGNIITYGFNSRASVTASSVRDNCVTICVQRPIPTLGGARIEQQEFNVTTNARHRDNIAHMLAAVAVALIDDGPP